jgi:peptidyl-prolyl cis-trans isomerase C
MPTVPPDRVIISYGDVKITSAQFEEIIGALPAQYQVQARGVGRKQFADNLVRVMVLAQEAKRRQLDQTQKYKVQSQFQNANLLAGMAFEEIGKDAKIDDAELHKYYEEHKKDFEEAHARHILIRMQGSPVPAAPEQKELTEAEALAKTQELRKKLQGGYDFATLAKEESNDIQSGSQGGDLGTFHHNQMVPAFDEAAFKLKPGELSEPVKTPFGYHLIKMETIGTKSFEEAKPEIEKRLKPEMAQKSIQDLEKKANVVLRSGSEVKTRKLEIDCPQCGSGEVFYSCTPNCCFNHVCSNCGTTFEPVTTATGGALSGVVPPDPLPEAADPTAACAKCDSTAVYMTDGGPLVCGKCGALLNLELTEICPG